MFQMSNGEILVCGDVDTGTMGAAVNEAGSTWVIKPLYDASEGHWILADGQEPPPPAGENLWHDSFYDGAVLYQEVKPDTPERKPDRVLLFGGSRDDAGTGNWIVNDEVWEFVPAGGSEPIVQGAWKRKVSPSNGEVPQFVPLAGGSPFPAFERVFANAVILPTGNLFLVGGSSVDDGAGHCESDTVPVDPVIYDSGSDSTDPGAVYEMPANARARIYHSTAAPLPDGRVLAAGGKREYDAATCSADPAEPDPRYTGEIFSPPYLDLAGNGFGSRPSVSIDQITIPIGGSFEIEVTRDCQRVIDRIVLLRPAAVTHHFDNDQRYVELMYSVSSTEPGGPEEEIDTILVTSPGSPTLAPPGYYMLFAIESDGCTDPATNRPTSGHRVPSVAKFVRLK